MGAYSAKGWEGSLTGNFNRFLGLEADISDHYKSPISGSHSNNLSFLFGPHVTFRWILHVNPFAHALVGATRGTISANPFIVCPQVCAVGHPCPPCSPPGNSTAQTQTVLTTALGGGIDVKATRFVWIRLIQADYLRPYFSHDNQNNTRLSFGVVLRFGR